MFAVGRRMVERTVAVEISRFHFLTFVTEGFECLTGLIASTNLGYNIRLGTQNKGRLGTPL
jgi:hypothetical protein